jgi:exonuclease 3'-5' domain-containing protein 1
LTRLNVKAQVEHHEVKDASSSDLAPKVGSRSNAVIVDTAEAVARLVALLMTMKQEVLFVDLEGVDLGRKGELSILQLYMASMDVVYLVDVHTLGKAAFDTADKDGSTLQSIFSGPMRKALYDVRADNDALYNLYNVDLDNVHDLQLMEVATRASSERFNRYVFGLSKALAQDGGLSVSEMSNIKRIKEAGLNLFAPERGGSYQVFNKRSMPLEIIDYCAGDVFFLPRLLKSYQRRMSASWKDEVEREGRARLQLAKSRYYSCRNRENARKPAGW